MSDPVTGAGAAETATRSTANDVATADTPPASGAIVVALFAVATFLNAALLFAVEPMFTKLVLPLLGGSPSVWNTALLFFQAALLVGYLYAHLTSRWLAVPRQAALHLGLLALSLTALPIVLPPDAVPPTTGTGAAIAWLLALLATTLGAPFVLLAAGTPLLQRWFASTRHPRAGNPYFLYVASNAGSFVALLAYPTLIEPRLRLSEQGREWAIGYGVLVLLVLVASWVAWRWRMRGKDGGGNGTVKDVRGSALNVVVRGGPPRPDTIVPADVPLRTAASHDVPPIPSLVPTAAWRLRCILLSFAPSSLLLGVTTFISTDIAAVPFLWVVPLALYLLTFVIVFARKPLLNKRAMLAMQVVLGLGLMVLIGASPTERLGAVTTLHLETFFVMAMVCHRELADSRPRAEDLTEFYLWMSLGGLLGGVFNVLLAPLLYDRVLEYPIALVIAFALRPLWPTRGSATRARILDFVAPLVVFGMITLGYQLPSPPGRWGERALYAFLGVVVLIATTFYRRPLRLALSALAIFIGIDLGVGNGSDVLYQARSFFGVYRVRNWNGYVLLQHGTTTHGGQSVIASRKTDPLTYYHRAGPLGDIFGLATDWIEPRNVALVGLGTGTTACYARSDEQWTYFEIDPLVVAIAREPRLFTYLRDCQPGVRIVMGDARLSLRASADSSFDLIVLDAFSSDAIPVHLMTREALQLYRSKLRPWGVIAFHISNRYLDLRPVLVELARDAGMAGATIDRDVTEAQRQQLYYGSRWVVMANSAHTLAPLVREAGWDVLAPSANTRLWTDDYSDVLGARRR